MKVEVPVPEWLSKWNFEMAREASTPSEERKAAIVDHFRDVQQVKDLLRDTTITPAMLLDHPFIKLTADARKFLEEFAPAQPE
jgi:hypothetical protein